MGLRVISLPFQVLFEVWVLKQNALESGKLYARQSIGFCKGHDMALSSTVPSQQVTKKVAEVNEVDCFRLCKRCLAKSPRNNMLQLYLHTELSSCLCHRP